MSQVSKRVQWCRNSTFVADKFDAKRGLLAAFAVLTRGYAVLFMHVTLIRCAPQLATEDSTSKKARIAGMTGQDGRGISPSSYWTRDTKSTDCSRGVRATPCGASARFNGGRC